MSRIGRRPVPVPNGVTVDIKGQKISVKGPKGELSRTFHPEIKLALEGAQVARPDLRIALGSVEIHALAFAGIVEALREAGRGLGRDATSGIPTVTGDRSPQLLPGRHPSSSSKSASGSPAGAAVSRLRTTRAFEPSKAPM